MIETIIMDNFYQDSVKLMLLSRKLKKIDGVEEASAVMATASNLDILRAAGLLTEQARKAKPDDIAVVVKAVDERTCKEAFEAVRREFSGIGQGNLEYDSDIDMSPKSLKSAAGYLPGAKLALISVPGQYAFHLADQALDLEINPMIFSDNVSVADELRLKEKANQKGLIVMGPDCGTAILDGICIGFGNRVRRGGIGVAGASGTGIQEFVSLVHNNGGGISHAIGTGGRDLHRAVGGISMLKALDILNEDPDTKLIVLLSKPADAAVAARIRDRAAGLGKPVLICFIGSGENTEAAKGLHVADTLENAAVKALELTGAPIRKRAFTVWARVALGGSLAIFGDYSPAERWPTKRCIS